MRSVRKLEGSAVSGNALDKREIGLALDLTLERRKLASQHKKEDDKNSRVPF